MIARLLVLALLVVSAANASAQSTDRELSITDIAAQMKRGDLTSHTLVQRYLDRIAKIDKAGPTINAIIELNPDALAIADALDAERKRGKLRGPLHGIPVLIKDNIDTADKMHTSAGSLALADSIPAKDSAVAEQLRKAGAVILGKTNLSEWANFRSSRSSSGWSGRGGLTRNPYALDRNPCGSSAGTGAGIAANLATVGVGTETDGSIVCPSATNGLVGIKPTVGLIGGAGIVPISHSQDTAGPMARTVADATILLSALATDSTRRKDYAKSLDALALKGARIGAVRKFADSNPEAKALYDQSIAALRAAGATIVDVELPNLGKYDDAENIVLQFEFKHDLNAYLASLPSSSNVPRSLAELIEFDKREGAREMPWFGQELFEQSQARGDLTDAIYLTASKDAKRMAGKEGIDAALASNRVEALIAPTGGPAWVTDLVNGDHFDSSSSSPAAVAGYPAITVPMGNIHGLPVGISFFGAAWSEPTLIRFAYAFEQATHARKPPTFAAHVE
jgi:amidase